MDTIQAINLIITNPNIRGGRPCIAGTGLRVTDIVMATIFHHQTPSEIASDYEVTMAQVHAALAYYYQHKVDIDVDIREQIIEAREYKEKRLGSTKSSLLP
ncbi:MAG: DUF433 domain-containing protein [Anaerolineae bacterium]|nr:DUF433 domain-containing protein [Anaerolineae bacterium]MDQ7035637.1 DUF433 domain-containing protein [Anaerolineae bacterium]